LECRESNLYTYISIIAIDSAWAMLISLMKAMSQHRTRGMVPVASLPFLGHRDEYGEAIVGTRISLRDDQIGWLTLRTKSCGRSVIELRGWNGRAHDGLSSDGSWHSPAAVIALHLKQDRECNTGAWKCFLRSQGTAADFSGKDLFKQWCAAFEYNRTMTRLHAIVAASYTGRLIEKTTCVCQLQRAMSFLGGAVELASVAGSSIDDQRSHRDA
jgi:hypothetical protein